MNYFLAGCVMLLVAAVVQAREFYGKLDVGAGSLTSPDITDSGVRKGGFTAVFQGLFGGEVLRYGAEFGVIEAYTSWDKDGLNLKNSLIFVPLSGVVQLDLAGGGVVPYLSLSAGPYLAVESIRRDDGGNSSAGSKIYGGAALCGGVRLPVSAKYDMHISARYSRINAGEKIEMVGLYVGLGGNLPFFEKSKLDALHEPIPERAKEDKPL